MFSLVDELIQDRRKHGGEEGDLLAHMLEGSIPIQASLSIMRTSVTRSSPF